MAIDFTPLDGQARRILATLLSRSFPGRDDLVQQVPSCRGRQLDDHDCLALSVVGAPPASVIRRIPVEAEVEDADGMTIHVLLHVVDGYMIELEVYREDGGELRAPLRVDGLRVVIL